jgi:hypothetical protein
MTTTRVVRFYRPGGPEESPDFGRGGKALFKDVKQRHALKLVGAKPLKSGKVSLIYKYGHLD